MNKKKLIASILGVLALFVLALRLPSKNPLEAQEAAKQPTKVSAKSVAESKTLTVKNSYPASVVGDQEVKITAKTGGTIIVAPGNIGSFVGNGALLAKIDNSGSLASGDEGFKNLQIQQNEIAAAQAKKSYSLAKDNYEAVRKSDSSTSAQKDSAKTQKEIAKLQYENALLGLSGAVDNHLIISPISGVITNKAVSVGDSVSVGQLIATVSKSTNIKVQFFVDQETLALLTRGQEVSALDADGNLVPLFIQSIASAADQTTKRFLIEAYPKKQSSQKLLAGTVVSISIETTFKPKNAGNIILPLSAINIGQNESSILISENGIAKKIIVTVAGVQGEAAEIAAPLSDKQLIIVDGNKLVHDGEAINAQK